MALLLLSLVNTPVAKGPICLVILSNPSKTLGNRKRKYPPENLGGVGYVFSPQAMDITMWLVTINAVTEKLPAWQKKTKYKALMDSKRFRLKTKVNVDAFDSNVLKVPCAGKYLREFKGTTIEYTKTLCREEDQT